MGDVWATTKGTATAGMEGVAEGAAVAEARVRGACIPRRPFTPSKDTSQLGPFLLIQNHPCVQISEYKRLGIQNTGVKHANIQGQNVLT